LITETVHPLLDTFTVPPAQAKFAFVRALNCRFDSFPMVLADLPAALVPLQAVSCSFNAVAMAFALEKIALKPRLAV
jgi:hypothetical protein